MITLAGKGEVLKLSLGRSIPREVLGTVWAGVGQLQETVRCNNRLCSLRESCLGVLVQAAYQHLCPSEKGR